MELSAFTNLFQNLQNYVVGILNEDEILQQMGCVFLSENSLDIEYQIRDALNKQGMACVVMTPKATYQGHNGIQQTFTCDELTIQVVENPIINRARLKKAGLEHGTGLDVVKQASDRLAGPQGGYFGQFTTKRIQEAEQGGLLVCTATFGCTVYERLDAVISGDLSGNWVEVPFVRTSELSDYIDDYLSSSLSGYMKLDNTEGVNVILPDNTTSALDFTDHYGNSLLGIDTQNFITRTRFLSANQIYSDIYWADDIGHQIGAQDAQLSDFNYLRVVAGSGYEGLKLGDAISAYVKENSGGSIDDKTYVYNYVSSEIVSAFDFSGTLTRADVESMGLDTSTIYSIRIGTAVSAIGDGAFLDVPLWEVEAPYTLQEIGVSAFAGTTTSKPKMRYFGIYGRDKLTQWKTTANSAKGHEWLKIKPYAFANNRNVVRMNFPLYNMVGLTENSFYNFQIYSPLLVGHGVYFDDIIGLTQYQMRSYIESWNGISMSMIGMPDTNPKPYFVADYAWIQEQHFGETPWNFLSSWTYTSSVRMSMYSVPAGKFTVIQNLANDYNTRTRTWQFQIFTATSADVSREGWLDLSVDTNFTKPNITFSPTSAHLSAINFDLDNFFDAGTRRLYHIFEYEPGRFALEQMYKAEPEYVQKVNSEPLTITVPNDNGFTLQTTAGNALITHGGAQQIGIGDLSAGRITLDPNGYIITYAESGGDANQLSAWNWLRKNNTGLGTLLQNQHTSIMNEVGEDYVSFNWLLQQGYLTTTSADQRYLALSGGTMSGDISCGDAIGVDFNGVQIANGTQGSGFAVYVNGDAKYTFYDLEETFTPTGIYEEGTDVLRSGDLYAVMGDLSTLIHET